MSHLRRISIELKDGQKIARALQDLALQPVFGSSLTENNETLHSRYGLGDKKAAIVVPFAAWRTIEPRASDGIAFAWNGSGYDLIQDGMDSLKHEGLDRLRQRYAFHELQTTLHEAGWEVSETATNGDQLELIFRKY